MTEKAPKIHIETPLKNYAFTEHTISKVSFFQKRDLKGFKCMTVSLDVFRDFSRLFAIWNHSKIL